MEADANADLDLRPARHLQLQPAEPAQSGGAPRWLVLFHPARCQSAAESGDPDRPRQSVSLRRRWRSCSPERHSPGKFEPEHRAADRLRHFQRHLAGQRRRSGGNESAIRADLSGRPAGQRRRYGHRTGRAKQRRRCHHRGQSEVHHRVRAGTTLVCIAGLESRDLPSAGRHHRRPRRRTPRAVLHAVEPRHRASVRQLCKRAGAVCRHARGEPALPHAG